MRVRGPVGGVEHLRPRGSLGFGRPLQGSEACRTLNRQYGYGLGVVRHGSWSLQNPLFAGYGGVEAYLPSKRTSVAVVATVGERTFGPQQPPANMATPLFSGIARILASESLPTGP